MLSVALDSGTHNGTASQVGESWPPRNDAIQQSKGLTILPPLERPVSDGFDEDEEKQSTLKATAKQQGLLSAPSVNTLDSLSFMGDTIKGSVQLLGTKKQVTADEQDLAFDVDLPDDLDSRLKSGTIKPRASFESHISVEGEELSGLPCSSSIKRPSSATSSRASARLPRDSLSSQAESADECVEDGFDIPHDLASLSLSPKRPRNQHARISSASSTCTTHNLLSDEPSQSRSRVRTLSSTSGHSARSGEHSSTSMLLRPSHSQHRVKKPKSSVTTIQSPSSASHSAASADEVEVDFFQDIDLPDFFGTATGNQSSSPLSGVAPPASLPARPDTSGKCPGSVDLQSMLNAKLSERLRRSEAEEVSLPFSPTSQQQLPQSRRRRHREKPAEQFEDGLIVEEGSFLRKPPRGGSLDSWALFQQNPSAAPSNHGRGESANAIMQPGGTSSSILGRKGLVHSKSFIKALSDAHAQTLPGGRVSVPQPNLPSAQQASSSRSLSTTSRPTLNRKRSTPQLQPKPNSADIVRQSTTPYSSSNADSSRQRTLSLPRKTSMPLLSAASSRSSTPSLSHYAQPTQGSRLKHLANDASRTITASPVIPSTRPNTPAAPGAAVRLTLPTLSSKAKQKQKSSPLQSSYEANPSRCASDPTGSTSSILFPSGSATVNRSSLGSVNILRKPKKGVIYGEGTELDAFDDLPANKEKERRFQSISRGRPVESTAPSLRKPVSRHASRPKKSDKGKRRERAQPQLIRNLGPAHAAKGLLLSLQGHPF